MILLPECTNHCGVRTDTGGLCRICAKICPQCAEPIDDHEEGKLRNCLIKLAREKTI